jgi:hypothetical protein
MPPTATTLQSLAELLASASQSLTPLEEELAAILADVLVAEVERQHACEVAAPTGGSPSGCGSR